MKNFIKNIYDNLLYIISIIAFIGMVACSIIAFKNFEFGIIGTIVCGVTCIVELIVQGINEIKLDLMNYIDADHEDMLVDINNIINPIVDDDDIDIPTIIRNSNK